MRFFCFPDSNFPSIRGKGWGEGAQLLSRTNVRDLIAYSRLFPLVEMTTFFPVEVILISTFHLHSNS